MHYSNRLLSDAIVEAIETDEDASWRGIEKAIENLLSSSDRSGIEDDEDLLPSHSLGGLLRMIVIHQDLKYNLNSEQLLKLCNTLMTLYTTKRLSIPFQIKVLNQLHAFFKYRVDGLVFSQWRTLWDSSLFIVTRRNKAGAIANEQMNSNLLTAIVTLLHSARNYIPPSDVTIIVTEAMLTLQDLRAVRCIEGLLMLVNCLPTAYEAYDEILPQWINIWSKISNNQFWDCYWLTLFCRARKHSLSFDWSSLTSIILSKTRELLALPNMKGKSPQDTFFPFSIPNYYSRMVFLSTDARKIALGKIAKLSCFLSMKGDIVTGEVFSVTPPKLFTGIAPQLPGLSQSAQVHSGAALLSLFLRSVRTYFHPSQAGAWSSNITYYLTILVVDISRSIAKAYANKLWKDSDRDAAVKVFDNAPLDKTSVKYLSGCLLSLVFESLYGKNPMLLQLTAGCVKNLAALDPSFCDVILPFLLSALDPAAVNQSHQAPAALYALAVSFRYFLFPKPVVIPYLGELLKLSLNGIDANDDKKTSSTLALYAAIFSWIPLGSNLLHMKAAKNESYLESLNGPKSSKHDVVNINESLRYLSEYTIEWAEAFIDKVILVLESKEEKQAGKKDAFKLGNMIADTFETVLSAASPDARDVIVTKVMEYIKINSPKIASKEWAKLIDCITWLNPERLPGIVKILLDEDIKTLACSTDKLTFRIRLLGGSLRRCDMVDDAHTATCLSLFSSIATKDELLFHSDKSVRKTVAKFTKDLLRGKVANFLRAPVRDIKIDNTFGAPNDIAKMKVDWHTPTHSSVSFAVSVLNYSVSGSMQRITELLSSEESAFDASAAKSKEERVVALLRLMLKTLCGAAEVLGNTPSANEAAAGIPATGLSLLNSCPLEHKQYLLELRSIVFKFIHELQAKLRGQNEAMRILHSSSDVQKLWMKLLHTLVAIRLANLKNVNEAKKWYTMGKQMAASIITKTMAKLCRSRSFVVNPDPHQSFEFWIGHDLSVKTIYDRLTVQHAKRLYQLSYASTWTALKEEDSIELECMHDLIALTHHEYDGIRGFAIKYFEKTSARYGCKLNGLIKPMLTSISSDKTNYFEATGAFSLLSQARILKRISGQWNLFVDFVENFCKSQTMISAIPEQDRREKLMMCGATLLTKYSTSWHHLPLPSSSETEQLMEFVLRCCGYDLNGKLASVDSKSGLRYETLISYILIHLIGGDFPTPIGIWKWCLNTLRTEIGQPSQIIALCGLTKLAHIAVNVGVSESLRLELLPLFTATAWSELLAGMSACQSKARGDDAPQWGTGIDSMLTSVEYQRSILPRNDSNELDTVSFSPLFKKENAALMSNLLLIIQKSPSKDALAEILLESKGLTGSSEAEEKANIVTRAELFAADKNDSLPQIDLLLSLFLASQTEKASLDICKIWAEAVAFGFSSSASDPIRYGVSTVIDNFRSALQPAPVDSSDGFSAQAKSLLMLRALLTADYYASIKIGKDSAVGDIVSDILQNEDFEVFSTYRTGREEIGGIMGLLRSFDSQFNADRIIARMKSDLAKEDEPVNVDNPDLTPESFSKSISRGKQVLETACLWLAFIVHTTPLSRCSESIISLFELVLGGCANSEVEVADLCRETALIAANALSFLIRSGGSSNSITTLLDTLSLYKTSSWKVKEQALVCTGIILLKNSFIFSNDEKKICKSIFVDSFLDSRVELQYTAQICMTIYLSTKSSIELDALAEAYTKNCGIMADREKKKRRIAGGSTVIDKPDDTVVTTVMTVISLLNVFPFDMPIFVPSLICALVRLSIVPNLKLMISKAVQDFKRAHQDRWDEFKEHFTREQLEDLQGAGAAHYFS